MKIHIGEIGIFLYTMRTRMPFRYGIASVTELPHCFVRLTARINSMEQTGVAADHLAPKWFTKNPESSIEEDTAEMLRVIRHAADLAQGKEGDNVFSLWRRLYDAQADWGARESLAPLLTNFGVSLVERALIDAFCRASGRPFAALLRENAFGIRLGDIHPGLEGRSPADLLPKDAPLPRILARHTVGLSDPLTEAEIPEGERLTDGLPQSLEAAIRTYGLRHFKLKVGGDAEKDAARLERVCETIAANLPTLDWACTIDGNESYRTLESFRAFWDAATASKSLKPYLDRNLLFVEQPLHRDVTLSPEAGAAFAAWPDRPPIIIDESDAELSSLPTALSLGYAGTSHKNCKGVIKGVANACLVEALRRNKDTPRALMLSGEDLSNVGPVALLQDLAVQSALGIESIERNGHHYFTGLSMFPPDVQRQVAQAHPDLYHVTPQGWPTLTVESGAIALDSVNAAPFGCGFIPDVASFASRSLP